MKFTPLIKGFITAVVMLITTLCLFYSKMPATSGRYIVYAIYAGGIAWALIGYYRSPNYNGKFGTIFNQGFRCFVIVTLVMVIFTGIFVSTHPEFAEQEAKNYREFLIKEKNKTPAEIETEIAQLKKNYTVSNISGATFGYLMTGAIFTAAGAGLLLMRRK